MCALELSSVHTPPPIDAREPITSLYRLGGIFATASLARFSEGARPIGPSEEQRRPREILSL